MHYIRLVVLGDSQVGKTSLIRQLVGEELKFESEVRVANKLESRRQRLDADWHSKLRKHESNLDEGIETKRLASLLESQIELQQLLLHQQRKAGDPKKIKRVPTTTTTPTPNTSTNIATPDNACANTVSGKFNDSSSKVVAKKVAPAINKVENTTSNQNSNQSQSQSQNQKEQPTILISAINSSSIQSPMLANILVKNGEQGKQEKAKINTIETENQGVEPVKQQQQQHELKQGLSASAISGNKEFDVKPSVDDATRSSGENAQPSSSFSANTTSSSSAPFAANSSSVGHNLSSTSSSSNANHVPDQSQLRQLPLKEEEEEVKKAGSLPKVSQFKELEKVENDWARKTTNSSVQAIATSLKRQQSSSSTTTTTISSSKLRQKSLELQVSQTNNNNNNSNNNLTQAGQQLQSTLSRSPQYRHSQNAQTTAPTTTATTKLVISKQETTSNGDEIVQSGSSDTSIQNSGSKTTGPPNKACLSNETSTQAKIINMLFTRNETKNQLESTSGNTNNNNLAIVATSSGSQSTSVDNTSGTMPQTATTEEQSTQQTGRKSNGSTATPTNKPLLMPSLLRQYQRRLSNFHLANQSNSSSSPSSSSNTRTKYDNELERYKASLEQKRRAVEAAKAAASLATAAASAAQAIINQQRVSSSATFITNQPQTATVARVDSNEAAAGIGALEEKQQQQYQPLAPVDGTATIGGYLFSTTANNIVEQHEDQKQQQQQSQIGYQQSVFESQINLYSLTSEYRQQFSTHWKQHRRQQQQQQQQQQRPTTLLGFQPLNEQHRIKHFNVNYINNMHLYEINIVDMPPIEPVSFPTSSLLEWSLFKGQSHLLTADAYLLVFDLTRPSTIQYIKVLRDKIFESREMSNIPVYVIANKADLCPTLQPSLEARRMRDVAVRRNQASSKQAAGQQGGVSSGQQRKVDGSGSGSTTTTTGGGGVDHLNRSVPSAAAHQLLAAYKVHRMRLGSSGAIISLKRWANLRRAIVRTTGESGVGGGIVGAPSSAQWMQFERNRMHYNLIIGASGGDSLGNQWGSSIGKAFTWVKTYINSSFRQLGGRVSLSNNSSGKHVANGRHRRRSGVAAFLMSQKLAGFETRRGRHNRNRLDTTTKRRRKRRRRRRKQRRIRMQQSNSGKTIAATTTATATTTARTSNSKLTACSSNRSNRIVDLSKWFKRRHSNGINSGLSQQQQQQQQQQITKRVRGGVSSPKRMNIRETSRKRRVSCANNNNNNNNSSTSASNNIMNSLKCLKESGQSKLGLGTKRKRCDQSDKSVSKSGSPLGSLSSKTKRKQTGSEANFRQCPNPLTTVVVAKNKQSAKTAPTTEGETSKSGSCVAQSSCSQQELGNSITTPLTTTTITTTTSVTATTATSTTITQTTGQINAGVTSSACTEPAAAATTTSVASVSFRHVEPVCGALSTATSRQSFYELFNKLLQTSSTTAAKTQLKLGSICANEIQRHDGSQVVTQTPTATALGPTTTTTTTTLSSSSSNSGVPTKTTTSAAPTKNDHAKNGSISVAGSPSLGHNQQIGHSLLQVKSCDEKKAGFSGVGGGKRERRKSSSTGAALWATLSSYALNRPSRTSISSSGTNDLESSSPTGRRGSKTFSALTKTAKAEAEQQHQNQQHNQQQQQENRLNTQILLGDGLQLGTDQYLSVDMLRKLSLISSHSQLSCPTGEMDEDEGEGERLANDNQDDQRSRSSRANSTAGGVLEGIAKGFRSRGGSGGSKSSSSSNGASNKRARTATPGGAKRIWYRGMVKRILFHSNKRSLKSIVTAMELQKRAEELEKNHVERKESDGDKEGNSKGREKVEEISSEPTKSKSDIARETMPDQCENLTVAERELSSKEATTTTSTKKPVLSVPQSAPSIRIITSGSSLSLISAGKNGKDKADTESQASCGSGDLKEATSCRISTERDVNNKSSVSGNNKMKQLPAGNPVQLDSMTSNPPQANKPTTEQQDQLKEASSSLSLSSSIPVGQVDREQSLVMSPNSSSLSSLTGSVSLKIDNDNQEQQQQQQQNMAQKQHQARSKSAIDQPLCSDNSKQAILHDDNDDDDKDVEGKENLLKSPIDDNHQQNKSAERRLIEPISSEQLQYSSTLRKLSADDCLIINRHRRQSMATLGVGIETGGDGDGDENNDWLYVGRSSANENMGARSADGILLDKSGDGDEIDQITNQTSSATAGGGLDSRRQSVKASIEAAIHLLVPRAKGSRSASITLGVNENEHKSLSQLGTSIMGAVNVHRTWRDWRQLLGKKKVGGGVGTNNSSSLTATASGQQDSSNFAGGSNKSGDSKLNNDDNLNCLNEINQASVGFLSSHWAYTKLTSDQQREAAINFDQLMRINQLTLSAANVVMMASSDQDYQASGGQISGPVVGITSPIQSSGTTLEQLKQQASSKSNIIYDPSQVASIEALKLDSNGFGWKRLQIKRQSSGRAANHAPLMTRLQSGRNLLLKRSSTKRSAKTIALDVAKTFQTAASGSSKGSGEVEALGSGELRKANENQHDLVSDTQHAINRYEASKSAAEMLTNTGLTHHHYSKSEHIKDFVEYVVEDPSFKYSLGDSNMSAQIAAKAANALERQKRRGEELSLILEPRYDKKQPGAQYPIFVSHDLNPILKDLAQLVRKHWKCNYIECSAASNWNIRPIISELTRTLECNKLSVYSKYYDDNDYYDDEDEDDDEDDDDDDSVSDEDESEDDDDDGEDDEDYDDDEGDDGEEDQDDDENGDEGYEDEDLCVNDSDNENENVFESKIENEHRDEKLDNQHLGKNKLKKDDGSDSGGDIDLIADNSDGSELSWSQKRTNNTTKQGLKSKHTSTETNKVKVRVTSASSEPPKRFMTRMLESSTVGLRRKRPTVVKSDTAPEEVIEMGTRRLLTEERATCSKLGKRHSSGSTSQTNKPLLITEKAKAAQTNLNINTKRKVRLANKEQLFGEGEEQEQEQEQEQQQGLETKRDSLKRKQRVSISRPVVEVNFGSVEKQKRRRASRNLTIGESGAKNKTSCAII